MLEDRLKRLWGQLQAKKPHMKHFLSEIRLEGIRGIKKLRVFLDYPVSVIAGGNASGKSTVLFSAACAYDVPGAGVRDYVPSTLFPDYRPKQGNRSDGRPGIIIEYDYLTPEGTTSMRWARRAGGWNRSFLGRKGAEQPKRMIYLRTLTNLSSPSEVRSVLRMSHLKTPPDENLLTAAQIDFAQQMLPFQYQEVAELSGGARKNLLFAAHRSGTSYSELHMAAGERAILRLSREIAQLKGALVLIDEVEAGLHPWVQQLLMLHLQQLALRNDLQVIVTSHSPVVLGMVPDNARIFLERDEEGDVQIHPPYRDIIQDALYGRSHDTLNLLCEDESAEAILNGILDVLQYELGLRSGLVRVGRNTGASEFPGHAAAFRKFGLVENFAFVLDGDQRDSGMEDRIREVTRDPQTTVLFLPSDHSPEEWVWERLGAKPEAFAKSLGMSPDNLRTEMANLDRIYDAASDTEAEISKTKLKNLAEKMKRSVPDICRAVAKGASEDPDSDIQPLVARLKDLVAGWRAD